MSFLVIGLPEAAYTDQALDFVLLAEGEAVEAGRVQAAQLPQVKDRQHEVVALVPPRMLSWHPVQLPPGIGANSPRLRAVLEGLLEDALLDPPAELHLILAGDSSAGPQWVAACERRWLSMAVQGLEAAGCRLSRVLPEWGPPGPARVHVSGSPGQLQMLLCGPQGIRQLDLHPDNLAWALHEARPGTLPLSAEPELVDLAQAQLQQPVQPWLRSQRWAAAALPRWDLARGLRMRRQVQRSPLQWFQAPRWRAARWATLGLLGVNLAGFNALAWSHSVQLQSRREQMRQLLVQTFPQAQPQAGVEPPAQMQRELERLRAASAQPQPDDLAVMLGAVLPALPTGQAPQALDYATGQLRLQGLQLSPGEFEALQARLRAQGYSAQMQGPALQVRTAS